MMVSETGLNFVQEERRKLAAIEEAKLYMRHHRTSTQANPQADSAFGPQSRDLNTDRSGNKEMDRSQAIKLFKTGADDPRRQLFAARRSSKIMIDTNDDRDRKRSTHVLKDSSPMKPVSPESLSRLSPTSSLNAFNFLNLVAMTKRVRSLRSPKKEVFRVANPVEAMDTMALLKESLRTQKKEGSGSQYVKQKLLELSDNLREYQRQENFKEKLKNIGKKTDEVSIRDAIEQKEIEGRIDQDKEKEGCIRDLRVFQDLRKIEKMNQENNSQYSKHRERAYLLYERRLERESEAQDVVSGVARLQAEFNTMFEETSRLQTKKMPSVVGRAGLQGLNVANNTQKSLAAANTGHFRSKSLHSTPLQSGVSSRRVVIDDATEMPSSSVLFSNNKSRILAKSVMFGTEHSASLLSTRLHTVGENKQGESLPVLPRLTKYK